MINFDFLKILEISVSVLSTLVTIVYPFFIQKYFFKKVRQKVVRSLFLCEKFLNFLNIWEEDKQFKKEIKILTSSLILWAFLLSITFYAKSNFAPIITLSTFFVLPFFILIFVFVFPIIFEFKFSILIKPLKILINAFYFLVMAGVVASYFTLYLTGNHLMFLLFFLIVYASMGSLVVPYRYIREFNKDKIKKKLSKKIKNSPTFQIFTSINHLSKISGKILDFYDDDFLVIKTYNKTIFIPWEKIETIEC
jgi:hypothetical protein